METNELKNIWQTLCNEKLIDKSIAKENIARIIQLRSSKIVERLQKKLKTDYFWNIAASILIAAITIFATLFLQLKNQHLPVQGYIFLVLAFSFYAFRAIGIHSRIKLLGTAFNTSSVLSSLKMVKVSIEKSSKKETTLTYISITALTIFANVLLNEKTDFSNFTMNSLQGYVFLFSVGYIIALPWIGNYYFKRRFSEVMSDLNQSIGELTAEQ
jgi:hypothetical protein